MSVPTDHSVHTWVPIPSCHITLRSLTDPHMSPDLTIAPFPHIGAEDSRPTWNDHWDWGPESHKSPSRKRARARSPAQGKGKEKGKGKGKSKSKGKGKSESPKGSQQKWDVRPKDIEIGCSAHKLKTTYTDTHVQCGKASISKAALAKICNCGPNDRC